MTSPRLRLWQALRDEYNSFHGSQPGVNHDWTFQSAELKHAVGPARRLHTPDEKVSKHLVGKLSRASQTELQNFDGKTAPTIELQRGLLEKLNELLNNQEFRHLYDEEEDRKSFNTLAAFKDHVEQNLSAVSVTDILQQALEYIRGNGK